MEEITECMNSSNNEMQKIHVVVTQGTCVYHYHLNFFNLKWI